MKHYTLDELRRLVAGHCREHGHGGQSEMSRQIGCTRQHLNGFLTGKWGPPKGLLEYYGLEKVPQPPLYVQKDGGEEE